MLLDSECRAAGLFDGLSYAQTAAALREVQGMLATLCASAMSMASNEEVLLFREALERMVKGVQARADEIENMLAEAEVDG
jgi:hypothetical protein